MRKGPKDPYLHNLLRAHLTATDLAACTIDAEFQDLTMRFAASVASRDYLNCFLECLFSGMVLQIYEQADLKTTIFIYIISSKLKNLLIFTFLFVACFREVQCAVLSLDVTVVVQSRV